MVLVGVGLVDGSEIGNIPMAEKEPQFMDDAIGRRVFYFKEKKYLGLRLLERVIFVLLKEERCRSGRTGLTRNQEYGFPYRGFESHPLRQ